MNPAQVEVKVTQDGFVNANSCGDQLRRVRASAARSAATSRAQAAETPTPNPDANVGGRPIVVEARYVIQVPIAFPPFPTTLPLTSKAVYRCEFTY